MNFVMRKYVLRCSLLFVALAGVALEAQAQLNLPRPSPKATVAQTVGTTEISIVYGRPSVKGRTIYGELVPYDQVWRTGANEATIISFSDAVKINDQPLAAGRYSLHTLPGKDEWTIIFNRTADQWGSYQYDVKQDALRVRVRPETAPKMEQLTFGFPVVNYDSAQVAMHWDTLRVPFTVAVEADQNALAGARTAIAAAKPDDWRTPLQAAMFAFDRNIATEDALTWVNKSIAVQEDYRNLSLKARIMQKRGDTAQARQLATRAITLGKAAKPQPADVSAMEKLLAEIK